VRMDRNRFPGQSTSSYVGVIAWVSRLACPYHVVRLPLSIPFSRCHQLPPTCHWIHGFVSSVSSAYTAQNDIAGSYGKMRIGCIPYDLLTEY
jgi:hypothetical protein